MAGPLIVVDAPSLMYRSFFALPKSIRGADGKPVNALLGTANALLAAWRERKPATRAHQTNKHNQLHEGTNHSAMQRQRPPRTPTWPPQKVIGNDDGQTHKVAQKSRARCSQCQCLC